MSAPGPTASTAGVLRPEEFARHVTLERDPAGGPAAHWAENHWSLSWDLPHGRWFASEVLPHPTCSLTVERGSHPRPDLPPGESVVITGVCTRRFEVDVRGWGRVLGVKFRPGGLAALTGVSASAWTDRTVAAAAVLPAELCATLADPDLQASPERWRAAVESGLAGIRPEPDPRYDRVLAVVGDMLRDPDLLSVSQVCERHDVSARSLQRLFDRYVGLSPRWVLARYRLHDALSEIDGGYAGSLTDLAHRHGWYDQAHFTRDFTALVGVPPGSYRRRGG